MDKTNIPKTTGGDSRRSFLKKTATASAVLASGSLFKTPVYGQSTAPSTGKVIGANDRIVVGYIGVGGTGLNGLAHGQGLAHVKSQKENASGNNIAQSAVCDVFSKRADYAKGVIGGECEVYTDYRKLLERKDIDAVVIATVDHWHTRCSVDAMNAGKHVYVEKPMTRYIGEAFEIYDAVKKTGKVLQVGSQGCSDAKWHKAAEIVQSGKIGKVVLSQGSYMRNNPKGEWNYGIDKDANTSNVLWKQWVGTQIKSAPKDFDPDHYFRWRKYYPYCAGLLGDLFPHKPHPYMLATGNPEFPVRVSAVGSKSVHSDKNTQNTYERDVPEIIQLIAEFPSGMLMHITSSTVNEQGTQEMIRGHKASLVMAGNRIDLKPERPFTEDIDPATFDGIKPGESIAEHEKNWFECIRTGKTPNCNIDLAVKVQTVISLAEMSERLNVMCLFDPKTRKVTTGDGRPVKALTYGSLPLS
jgi:predicted dehydrogenase